MATKDIIETQLITKDLNTDIEVVSLDPSYRNQTESNYNWPSNLKYFVAGIFFGVFLVKAEVISWFRIQEMFRLQSFHMFGILGSAVVVGIISIWVIKKYRVRTIYGKPIELHPIKFNRGQIYGGILFGFGWALTGACPGPLFAQIGSGVTVITVTLISAIAGTWVYGYMREKLPH